MSLLVGLGILSSLYFRQRVYEIFLKTHLLLALALMVVLWFHVPQKHRRSMTLLAVSSGVWLLQESIWLGRLGYQHLRTSSSKGVHIIKHSSTGSSAEAIGLTLSLKRPWIIRPGQYIYITLPGLSRHHGGFAQAHPYIIAWTEGSEITLLIQRHTGFSNDLFITPRLPSSFIIDGPYGHPRLLSDYDKALFVASGIGVGAHLLAIRELLKAHEDRSARVRRVTLLWFIECIGKFHFLVLESMH
jgi:predicted ferric reductase